MPMHEINRPGGSLGRSQACNLALRLYGDERITDDVLKTWLDRLFARNGWLSIGRKRPGPARVVLLRRRLLLLLRPLVRRPVHRAASRPPSGPISRTTWPTSFCRCRNATAAGGTTRSTTTTSNTAPRWPSCRCSAARRRPLRSKLAGVAAGGSRLSRCEPARHRRTHLAIATLPRGNTLCRVSDTWRRRLTTSAEYRASISGPFLLHFAGLVR